MNWKKELHPELVKRVERVIALAKSEGCDLRVVSAFRSHSEQHRLFLQRPRVTRADSGKSWHNFGLAADLAPFINGSVCWDEKKFKWSLIGKWAKRAGLEWGGDWTKFVDRPHVQLINGLTTAKAANLYKKSGNQLSGVWEFITASSKPPPPVKQADDLGKIGFLQQVSPVQTEESPNEEKSENGESSNGQNPPEIPPTAEAPKPSPEPPPIEVPQIKPEVEPDKEIGGIQASVAGAVTFITTTGAGILTWASGSRWEIVACLAIIGIIFVIARFTYVNAKEKRESNERMQRESRAQDLQILTLKSAMDKNLNTVVIQPTLIANSKI